MNKLFPLIEIIDDYPVVRFKTTVRKKFDGVYYLFDKEESYQISTLESIERGHYNVSEINEVLQRFMNEVYCWLLYSKLGNTNTDSKFKWTKDENQEHEGLRFGRLYLHTFTALGELPESNFVI